MDHYTDVARAVKAVMESPAFWKLAATLNALVLLWRLPEILQALGPWF